MEETTRTHFWWWQSEPRFSLPLPAMVLTHPSASRAVSWDSPSVLSIHCVQKLLELLQSRDLLGAGGAEPSAPTSDRRPLLLIPSTASAFMRSTQPLPHSTTSPTALWANTWWTESGQTKGTEENLVWALFWKQDPKKCWNSRHLYVTCEEAINLEQRFSLYYPVPQFPHL